MDRAEEKELEEKRGADKEEKVRPSVFHEKREGIATDRDLSLADRITGTKVPLASGKLKTKIPKSYKRFFRKQFYRSLFQETLTKKLRQAGKKLKSIWLPGTQRDRVLREGEDKEEGRKAFIDISPSDVRTEEFSITTFHLEKDRLTGGPEQVERKFDAKRPTGKTSTFLRGKRAATFTSESKGRIVGFHSPPESTADIAIVPTITKTVLRTAGGDSVLPVRPSSKDIQSNLRTSRAPATVILVLDLSESMVFHLPAIHRAVASLHRKAYRYRDRVGLVTLHGGAAKTVFHPVTNINVVARKIRTLPSGGRTPLALGLVKASRIATLERRRNREASPVVVLFSDGLATTPLPQPIAVSSRELVAIPAQADVLAAARVLGRRRVPVVALNPMHLEKWDHEEMMSPTDLLLWVTKITGGRYFGFKTGFFRSTLTPERAVEVVDSALGDILAR